MTTIPTSFNDLFTCSSVGYSTANGGDIIFLYFNNAKLLKDLRCTIGSVPVIVPQDSEVMRVNWVWTTERKPRSTYVFCEASITFGKTYRGEISYSIDTDEGFNEKGKVIVKNCKRQQKVTNGTTENFNLSDVIA